MTRLLAVVVVFALLVFSVPAAAQNDAISFYETVRIGRGAVQNVQWHPNGTQILVDTVTGAWIYDTIFNDIAHFLNARLARFQADGVQMAGIDANNSLILWAWNNSAYEQVAAFSDHRAYVTALEWRPGHNQIASLDRTGRILVRSISPKEIPFEAQFNGADQIVWSANGTYLAAMNSKTQVMMVWDEAGKLMINDTPQYSSPYGGNLLWLDDTQLMRQIPGEITIGEIWDVTLGAKVDESGLFVTNAYSPDGSKVANGYYDHVTIEDAVTRETLNTIQIDQPTVIEWSPDGEWVAVGSWSRVAGERTSVKVANAETGQTQWERAFDYTITQLAWNADSQKLAIVDFSSEIFVQSISNPGELGQRSIAHTEMGGTAAWSPDGSMIIAADTNYGSRVWNATTGAPIIRLMNIGQPASKIAWQPNGMLVATRSGDWWKNTDKNIYVWDIGTRQGDITPIAIIPHTSNIADMAWSPDGKTLASVERERYMRLWSPAEPETIHGLDLCADGRYCGQSPTTIGWSADGQIIHYAYSDTGNGGNVTLIDAATGKRLEAGSPNWGTDRAWTTDNRLIWVRSTFYHGSGGGMMLTEDYDLDLGVGYDAAHPDTVSTWEASTFLSGFDHPVLDAVLSPHANKLIGFDRANNALLWTLEPQSLRGRLSGVSNRAVWSPDETMLAVYGTDGVLRVVDAENSSIIHEFADHFQSLYEKIEVFWSPDSRKIALLESGVLFIYEKEG